MSQEQHRINVQKSLHSNPDYTAFCSCGWVGRGQTTETEAEQDGDDHIVAVVV